MQKVGVEGRMDEETKCLLDHIHKWEEEHPGEEMVFITLPKYDKEERNRVLQAVFRLLSEEDFENRKRTVGCAERFSESTKNT